MRARSGDASTGIPARATTAESFWDLSQAPRCPGALEAAALSTWCADIPGLSARLREACQVASRQHPASLAVSPSARHRRVAPPRELRHAPDTNAPNGAPMSHQPPLGERPTPRSRHDPTPTAPERDGRYEPEARYEPTDATPPDPRPISSQCTSRVLHKPTTYDAETYGQLLSRSRPARPLAQHGPSLRSHSRHP